MLYLLTADIKRLILPNPYTDDRGGCCRPTQGLTMVFPGKDPASRAPFPAGAQDGSGLSGHSDRRSAGFCTPCSRGGDAGDRYFGMSSASTAPHVPDAPCRRGGAPGALRDKLYRPGNSRSLRLRSVCDTGRAAAHTRHACVGLYLFGDAGNRHLASKAYAATRLNFPGFFGVHGGSTALHDCLTSAVIRDCPRSKR